MNYGGNMPDWHQYNSSQPIGSEVPAGSQNVTNSPIFGPSISPRRLNGPAFSPEGLNKPQNDSNFNPRNFQQSPNALNGQNVQPENTPMGSVAQMPGCNGPYGPPGPRNTMIEGTSPTLDSRNLPNSSLSEAMGQRNHQLSMGRPAAPLNCPTVNGSIGAIGQRNTPTSLQSTISTNNRQAPGSYIPCKGPCCNPDTNISYQTWEKFAPYPPNVPYREPGYPVDNRRYGNEFENREQLGSSAYNIDPRRNFPDYKYRKDPIIPRPYAHTPGVIQSYPVQNYNFPADYQKYPAYPIKEYPRENSIANSQNPGILKYQEQSVIVQQKYFTKQIQYQNGVLPTSMVSANMGSNVISRPQNSFFNQQLVRDYSRSYSENNALPNRGIQSANPIHASYPKYQMYQQKMAMQRLSMENHLRELSRIPGYQTHPKYQESVSRYRELLRQQQIVDYESSITDQSKVLTSQANEEIPPINLQFDQNGHLINTTFASTGFSNLQGPINLQSSKNVQGVINAQVGPQNLQLSDQFKNQTRIDDRVRDEELSSLARTDVPRENQQHYSFEKNQPPMQKYQSGGLNLVNSEGGENLSMEQKNSKDFADKPELDVRQFLANWDESEDEDGTNTNLPDVVLSNSTPVVESENATKLVSDDLKESENCSDPEDCRGRDDCGLFEDTQHETKPSDSTAHQIYQCDLPPVLESTNSKKPDLEVPPSLEKPVRTGTVIQSTNTECENETSLHIIRNLANSQATHANTKLLSQDPGTSNDNKGPAKLDADKDSISEKEELSIEEDTITCIRNHMETYSHEPGEKIHSNVEEIRKNDEDSRSSSGNESSVNSKHCFGSDEDLSQSSDSDTSDSDSISSFTKSPKTITGTEIHIDAQELSAIPSSPNSNSEMLDSTNLQKQNSFASEESHNPDDISLPDLPTSECTPISTTLNTPIHSDSEESSEPVIELTTPANPIEIIQNSPMLSFTHSPIKMELYEHFDKSNLTDKSSHDAIDFEFQASPSCDNDYGNPADVSSHTTEQFDTTQNDEDSLDSDYIEILSEKSDNNIGDNNCDLSRFASNKENVVATDKTSTTEGDTEHQPWSSDNVKEYDRPIPNNNERRDATSDVHKLESLSEMKDRLSIMPEFNKNRSKNDTVSLSNTKNYHGSSKWSANSEIPYDDCEPADNMTALNLVKKDNQEKLDPKQTTDKIIDPLVTSKESRSGCNSSVGNQVMFTSTEHNVEYPSPSVEDKIYTENIENQSSFTGALNIPLIPGEDFEEPKMPVLPMEGNCLTKIIKNTSPITDLDVLGSDDEKLDKMEEIWMEVGSMETVSKVTDVNVDNYADYRECSDREKSVATRSKLRLLPKHESRSRKNSTKARDSSKLFPKLITVSQDRESKKSSDGNTQLNKSSSSEPVVKELEPVNSDSGNTTISSTHDTADISQGKYNSIKVPVVAKVTSNNSRREDCKLKQDINLDNNATEIKKCKEKANHINYIATKLLENARLVEPETRKDETHRKDSSYEEYSRDSCKKRIKLLKEYRKVKNKINVDKPGVQSIESVDTIENSVLATIGITEQYRRIDADTIKLNSKFLKNQSVIQEPDISIFDSRSGSESQVMQDTSVNAEENKLDTVSEDVEKSENRLRRTFNMDKETLKDEATVRNNHGIVNIKDSITVEDERSIVSPRNFDMKVVSPIGEDVNECAINLSKASNEFGLLETLHVKGCATNSSNNSYASEDIKFEKPVHIESKTDEETICTDTKEGCSVPSESTCANNNAIYTKIGEKDTKTVEINHSRVPNIAEDNEDFNSFSTRTNLTNVHVSEDDIEQQPIRTTDYEEPRNLPDHIQEASNSPKPCKNPGKIVESTDESTKNCADVLKTHNSEMNDYNAKQSEYLDTESLEAVNDREDQKLAAETLRCEASHDSEGIQDDMVDMSTVNEEVSITKSLDASGENFPLNQADGKETSMKSPEHSVRSMRSRSEERIFKSEGDGIKATLNNHKQAHVSESSTVEKMLESEPVVVNDCSTNDERTAKEPQTESTLINEDPGIIETCSNLNESHAQTESEKSTEIDWLQNSNLELPLGTDESLRTVNTSSEVFGLENSFNCDFSNFDVAPNLSNAEDTNEHSSWKRSKEYARFEECERYKNPDNFVSPILTSLETLDSLNTVPVYTTKDGRITYSPNPKFTYRALIMEAREREGYPTMRPSNYGNSRNQEVINYSKNQSYFRKRKSSEGYSYSAGYSKQNYHEHYEPREHGESSTKTPTQSWSKNRLTRNKYKHQSRDQNTNRFTSYNGDTVGQGKVFGTYKREGYIVSDEHTKRKNSTSDTMRSNNRQQYIEFKEPSSTSVRSKSRWDMKSNPNALEIDLTKTDRQSHTTNANKAFHKDSINLERTISTVQCSNNLQNDNQSCDNQLNDTSCAEQSTSVSDKVKCTNESTTYILGQNSESSKSRDTQSVERKVEHSEIDESTSSSLKAENKRESHPNSLEMFNHELNRNSTTKPELHLDTDKSCENLPVTEEDYSEMKIPTKTLLDKIEQGCDKEIKAISLFVRDDNICVDKLSEQNENKLGNIDSPDIECLTTKLSPLKSPSRGDRFQELACGQNELNIRRNQSEITNVEHENSSCSAPLAVTRSNTNIEIENIPELLETSTEIKPIVSLDGETAEAQETENFDKLLHHSDDQGRSDCTKTDTPEINDANQADFKEDKVIEDDGIELKSFQQMSKVQDDNVALESKGQVSPSREDSCMTPEMIEIERNEGKIRSCKGRREDKNETSMKNIQSESHDRLSLIIVSEYENTTKSQSQFENYISYSPADNSPDDHKAIPKLVIKKTDSVNNKLSHPSSILNDISGEKVLEKEENGSKISVHPKIPKILIRNAKSRPSTPSIEEITEEESPSVTTKDDVKVPKVKIRFEEKSPRSPTVSSNESISKIDAIETKIPKMKIKLEDKLPKVIFETSNKESTQSNEEIQKTIPKMKIKKFRGALRQIVESKILPVSIPKMIIYTGHKGDKETSIESLKKKESDKNSKPVMKDSIKGDEKMIKDADPKKIPKLKITRQSSRNSSEMNRKRHGVSPVQSELKKVKKSSKVAESNDKRKSNKSTGVADQESLKKLDSPDVKQVYELRAGSESVKYATTTQSNDGATSEQAKSIVGNTPDAPAKIPKVIIKRTSPTAEFKCELSKGKRDAIIQNKRWQPEVKLQRSWVLDCMAKDLNLDRLRLKLATPNSILKQSVTINKPEVAAHGAKHSKVNGNRSDIKLSRSKSTSDLLPSPGCNRTVVKNDQGYNESNATCLARADFDTPKRCKSDLGSTFSECSKNYERKSKVSNNNHFSAIQYTTESELGSANELNNRSNTQFRKETNNVVERQQKIKHSNTNFEEIIAAKSCNEEADLMETSAGNSDKILDENMNSKNGICASGIDNEALDLNLKISTSSRSTIKTSKSGCRSFGNIEEAKNALGNPSLPSVGVNDTYSHNSSNKRKERCTVTEDSGIGKHTELDSITKYMKTGGELSSKLIKQVFDKEAERMELENHSNHTETVDEIIIKSAESAAPETAIATKSDIRIKNSDSFFSDAFNSVDSLETIENKKTSSQLDINDNPDDIAKKTKNENAVKEQSVSNIDVQEQENLSALDENVLLTSVIEDNNWTEPDAADNHDPNIHHASLNNGTDINVSTAKDKKSSEDRQSIIEMLSDSPNHSQNEIEIHSASDIIEENGVCLYHEDAIPTQFELELEIVDNASPDPLEVPLPQHHEPGEDCGNNSEDGPNDDVCLENGISENSRDSLNPDNDLATETSAPPENDSNFTQMCCTKTCRKDDSSFPDKEYGILALKVDGRIMANNTRIRTKEQFNSNHKKPPRTSDLLMKKTLAAKGRLPECLEASIDRNKFEINLRPKTAAEKKQGAGFHPEKVGSSCEDSCTTLENHSSVDVTTRANGSKDLDQNLINVTSNNENIQNQTKTESKVYKMKSERKHSKGSRNNLIEKKYSCLPSSVEKYTELSQMEERLIPKHCSTEIEKGAEFYRGETSVGLKNPKCMMKNDTNSVTRKKIVPELNNSKDSKFRSKSSRHDLISKYVGKSKSDIFNTEVQKSDLDLGQSEKKPVSNLFKHKHKSLKTSMDQSKNLTTDKTKFKLYKIPKIGKSSTSGTGRLIEELEESPSKEARMPILEPQIQFNGEHEVSELSSDRENSRSPPLITNQERRTALECQNSSSKDEELLSGRETTHSKEKVLPEAVHSLVKEITVAELVNKMAYHEKATIRHRRYCTLCERWFPTVARHRRHLSGYQHRHTELTQRRTIHALFTLFTGKPCPRLQPPGAARVDCEPGELTPLQIAVQGVTKELNNTDDDAGGNIKKKPTIEDK